MSRNESALLEAVRIVRQAGSEVTALFEALEPILDKAKESERPVVLEPGEWDGTYDTANEWVCETAWRTFPARLNRPGKGPRPKAGKLTFLVDFGRRDGPAAALGFPCAVVAWSMPKDESDWDFKSAWWPPKRDEVALVADRLFWWVSSPEDERECLDVRPIAGEWFYLVPLLALTDLAAAQRLLIEPMFALLASDAKASEALASAFANAAEVCRFAWSPSEGPPARII